MVDLTRSHQTHKSKGDANYAGLASNNMAIGKANISWHLQHAQLRTAGLADLVWYGLFLHFCDSNHE